MVFSTVSRDATSAYGDLCREFQVKPNPGVLTALKGHTLDTIEKFDLSVGYFGSKQVEIIAKLIPECPFLQSINLAGNSITSSVIETLCAGLARSVVQRVDISNNPMDIHSGQRILETLRQNIAITSCSVVGCVLPDYLVDDISVQVEMNELLFRNREVEKKEQSAAAVNSNLSNGLSSAALNSVCTAIGDMNHRGRSSPLNFDEISNTEDVESLADVILDDDISDFSAAVETEKKQLPQLLMQSGRGPVSVLLRGVTQRWIGSTETIKTMISSSMVQGAHYTDLSFPVDTIDSGKFWRSQLSSASMPNIAETFRWMRFPDYCREIGVSPTFQGKTLLVSSLLKGTRWFECAANVVRECDPLRSLTCLRALPDIGLFHFQFFKAETKVDIVVDDWVPVVGNASTSSLSLACLHNQDPSDAWAALLEKAYAKLHGGYAQLLGGSMRYALEDLTGAVCCKKTWTVSAVRLRGRENFFRNIRDHIIHRRIVAVKSSALGELQRRSLVASGIVPNRSYLLTNAIPLHDGTTFVVQLSSPTNALSWQGRYGPSSQELKNTPELQQLASSTSFWISFEDFVSMFDSAYVLNHIPSIDISLRVLSIDGHTADLGSSGALLGSGGWPLNDSILISTTSREAEVIVRVLQPDHRVTRGESVSVAGLEAHVVTDQGKNYDGWGTEACFSSCGGSGGDPSADSGCLVRGRELVIPVTVRKDAPLRLVVSSDRALSAYQVIASSTRSPFTIEYQPTKLLMVQHRGQWHGREAAGRHHNERGIKDSVQLLVTVAAAPGANSESNEDVHLLLDQGNARTPYSIGLVGKYGSQRIQNVSELQPLLSVDFGPKQTVGTTLHVKGNGVTSFVVIPMTWNSNEEGEYKFNCLSTTRRITIVELKP